MSSQPRLPHSNTDNTRKFSGSNDEENIEEFNRWCAEPQDEDENKWRSENKQITSRERFGDTWDTVLVPGLVSEALSLSDTSFGSLVNFGNILNSCFHYVVPSYCRCHKQVFTMICTKCYITFCSADCLRIQVENNGILSPEAKLLMKKTTAVSKPPHNPNGSNHHQNRKDQINNNSFRHHGRPGFPLQLPQPKQHLPQPQQPHPQQLPPQRQQQSPKQQQQPPKPQQQQPKNSSQKQHRIVLSSNSDIAGNPIKQLPQPKQQSPKPQQLPPKPQQQSPKPQQQSPKPQQQQPRNSTQKQHRIVLSSNSDIARNIQKNNTGDIKMSKNDTPSRQREDDGANSEIVDDAIVYQQLSPQQSNLLMTGPISGKNSNSDNNETTNRPPIFERILRDFDDFTSSGVKISPPRPLANKGGSLSSTSISTPSPLSSPSSTDTMKPYYTTVGRGRGAKIPMDTFDNFVARNSEQLLCLSPQTDEMGGHKLFVPPTNAILYPIDIPHEPPAAITSAMGCFHILSPSELGICISKGAEILEIINNIKQNQQIDPLLDFSIGGHAFSNFENDDKLYRIKILEIAGQNLIVYYVDYGNIGTVAKDSVLVLPDDLLDVQSWIVRFGISNVVPMGSSSDCEVEWSPKVKSYVNTLCYLKTVRVKILYTKSCDRTGIPKYFGTIKIQIQKKWKDLGELLIEKGLARMLTTDEIHKNINNLSWKKYGVWSTKISSSTLPPELPLGRKLNACVSHVNDLQDFYVSLTEDKSERVRISGELNRLLGRKHVMDSYNPAKGNLCAAWINNQWHRVKVQFIAPDLSAKVLQIDSGEMHDVQLDQLMEMPEDLKSHFGFAYHCKLPIVPKNSSKWDRHLIQKLKDLEKSSAECTQAKCFHIENGINVVELYPSRDSTGWSQALITIGDAQGETGTSNVNTRAISPLIDYQLDTPNDDPIMLKHVENENYSQFGQIEEACLISLEESPEIVVNSQREIESGQPIWTSKICLPNPPSLAKLEGSCEKFKTLINSQYLTQLTWHNMFFIVPVTNQRHKIEESLLKLKEHLDNNVKAIENFKPAVNDVVCASHNGVLMRGIVHSFDETSERVVIFFLDYGIYETLRHSDLLPINKEIMMFPPSGYLVNVQSESSTAQIMPHQLRRFGKKLENTAVTLSGLKASRSELQLPQGPIIFMADLKVSDGEQTMLSQMISNFTKMQWELYFDAGYKTSSAIVSRGEWPIKSLDDFYRNEMDVPLNKTTKKQILKFFDSEGVLYLLLLNDKPTFTKEFKKLCKMMTTYYNKVPRGDDEVAACDTGRVHFVAVRLTNQRSQISRKFDTLWHRCIKFGNKLRSLDDFAEWTVGEDQVAEIRELCPEFLEVPSASFLGFFPDIEMTDNVRAHIKEIKAIFSVGQEMTFIFTEVDKQFGEKSIYNLRCPAGEKLMYTTLESPAI